MTRKTMLLPTVLLLALAVAVSAGEPKAEAKGKSVEMEGTLVCLGCDLKMEQGARAACKDFGHRHALKTADGRLISFLENKYSADLIKGGDYTGKTIKVKGTYYADANVIDVESFEVGGKKMTWCDHCKAMDNCAAKGMKMK